MINQTAQIVIETAKAEMYNTVIITVWASVLLAFLLVAVINNLNKKVKWGNFWKLWLPTVVISAIVVAFIISSPAIVSEVINWIKGSV